jgi:hypothetical protein
MLRQLANGLSYTQSLAAWIYRRQDDGA